MSNFILFSPSSLVELSASILMKSQVIARDICIGLQGCLLNAREIRNVNLYPELHYERFFSVVLGRASCKGSHSPEAALRNRLFIADRPDCK